MPETRDAQSIVDAAAQAAAAGNYASAEELLREAAALQEASLGPNHPDVANTLNNLGVVCEITEKPAEAEQCFRRAYQIATAVFEPDHPFVVTSRKNLEDFTAARKQAVASPSPPSIVDDQDTQPIGTDDVSPVPLSHGETRPPASRRDTSPLAIAALVAGGLIVGMIAAVTLIRSHDGAPSSGAPSVPLPSPPTTAASPTSGAVSADASGKPQATATPSAAPRLGSEPASRPGPTEKPRATGKSTAQLPVVVSAQLCKDLATGGQWRCVPPAVPADPGPFFFYTRLKSPTGISVQHRWYRGDRLHQMVELSVLPNTAEGYRTYSRNTIAAGGAGEWRVELRTKDGVLLHEERFVVR